jgi:hypothetical protein
MNPSLATVASFSIGVFCGYLVRKNWYILRSIFGGKNTRAKTSIESKSNLKNETPKEFIEELETTTKSVSK